MNRLSNGRQKMLLNSLTTVAALLLICLIASPVHSGTYLFSKEPMPRDQILEFAHLYYDCNWRCDANNAYGTSISSARCPYGTTSGWKDTLPYCWGGDDEIYQYLNKMYLDKGAGDRDTSSSSPYYSGYVGSVDCSGFASQCFRSTRYSTSSFYNVTTELSSWDLLAPGDAINKAGSHIRLCDQYFTDTGLVLVYESTGYQWQMQHRYLSRTNDFDSNYKPVRYDYTTSLPSLVDARYSSAGTVKLEWLGAATTGFRVEQSTDGSSWTRIRDTDTLDAYATEADISGLQTGQTYYYRVRSVNGTTQTGPSTVFPVRLPSDGRPNILLVYGYDRWLRQGGTNSFNDFLIRFAKAMEAQGVAFETCDNFRVTRGEVDLLNYTTVIWMAGEESSGEHALNFCEMIELVSFLRAGGNLFISGSEIGWDLVEKAVAYDNLKDEDGYSIHDTTFFQNYLKAQYVEDDADTYSVQGASGTLFNGLSFTFDDGSQGTYNVQYPDQLLASSGGTACLLYDNGQDAAGIQYEGTFPNGSQVGSVVYFGFPFETIVGETARVYIMGAVLEFLGEIQVQQPSVQWEIR